MDKSTIFYILCAISIGFVCFVFISRYLTRHEPHDHDFSDDNTDRDDTQST